jgi:xanthine dehydrogenase YagS FAD-binding subunit
LQPGDCISAHPSDLAPALAACDASLTVASVEGERQIPLLDLYRRPTDDNRSLLNLARGEIVVYVRLLKPPNASVYLRAGERQAFSFPLVGVAAARYGQKIRVVASGVANTPLEVDAADPLAELPGNPQSAWKRKILATLVERALTQLALDREEIPAA